MAKASKISATLRTDFGKGFARRARVAGQVPATALTPSTSWLTVTSPTWLCVAPPTL